MERRRLGRTGFEASVVALGGAILIGASQREADRAIEKALECGVNYFDIAPTYGDSEVLVRPWVQRYRDRVFVACKTLKRTRDEAREELMRSLERVGVEYFDLYQFHGVSTQEDLEAVLGPGGALEAFSEAKEESLIRHIGITGHTASVLKEAFLRFDFDTVMFPLNFALARHRTPQNDYRPLLELARERNVGTLAIKSIAKGRWPEGERRYQTWYEPFDTQDEIDQSLWFVLSEGVTAAPTAGDLRLLDKFLEAGRRFRHLNPEEGKSLMKKAEGLQPLFS
ncbi:MAG TPA: aldo/keto reductase [Candidatus Latescibacteria bacterium]|nr:aldo/keto reductase [Candidatus Latescibacterota bacterium]